MSVRPWAMIVVVSVGSLAGVACGDDEGDGGAGGTASGTTTGGMGGSGGSGGAAGGTGGTASGTASGMGGGGGTMMDRCDMLCSLSEGNGCPDPQCVSNCEAIVSSANATNCTMELDAYFDCLFALPDVCNPLDCADASNTLVACTNM